MRNKWFQMNVNFNFLDNVVSFALLIFLFYSLFLTSAISQGRKEAKNNKDQASKSSGTRFRRSDHLVPPSEYKGETASDNNVKAIKSNPSSAIFKRPILKGESILVGVQKGGNLEEIDVILGYHMPETSEAKNARLKVAVVPPPFEGDDGAKNLWRICVYGDWKRGGVGLGWNHFPKNAIDLEIDHLQLELVQVPVDIPETELYMIPFGIEELKKEGIETHSVVIAITENRDELKKIINVSDQNPKFNWGDWFTKVEK